MFDFDKSFTIFLDNFDLFWYGTKITIILALVGTIAGLIIGLLFGAIRATTIDIKDKKIIVLIKKALKIISEIYIWFFRGTPMLVQAMFFYHGLRPFFQWNALTAGIMIISINTGAYMAEIVRSGIQSVDRGQSEGALSLGMTRVQTMKYIILPQAIRNSFPAIGNQFIINIKDSSMLNVIGVVELFFQSSSIAGSTMSYSATFLITCLVYLCLTSIATILLNIIEKRIKEVNSLEEKLNFLGKRKIDKAKDELIALNSILQTLNPLNTLGRGYSVIMDKKDKVINEVSELKKNDMVKVIMKDGSVNIDIKIINE